MGIFALVRKSSEHRRIKALFSLLGLSLVLLLSPCKVRHLVQMELGIPQTRVLNKGVSTISASNCLDFTVATNLQAQWNTDIQYPGPLLPLVPPLVFLKDLDKGALDLPSKGQPFPHVPLYILYRNLLIYS